MKLKSIYKEKCSIDFVKYIIYQKKAYMHCKPFSSHLYSRNSLPAFSSNLTSSTLLYNSVPFPAYSTNSYARFHQLQTHLHFKRENGQYVIILENQYILQ